MDELDVDELDQRIRTALHRLDPDDAFPPDPGTIRARVTRRRHRRRWTPVLALGAAVALIAGVAYFQAGPAATSMQTASSPEPSPAAGSATATQLAAGQWSDLPAPPVGQVSASLWTGSEWLVWGSTAGPGVLTDFARGAAYRPSAPGWQAIAAAPIANRFGAALLWTGRDAIVLGGNSNSRALNDGAAYNPLTNRWKTLPASPVPAGSLAVAWTGARLLVLSSFGSPIAPTSRGATYDPATNQWRSVRNPTPPAGHTLRWESAVAAGREVLAWSNWDATRPTKPGSSSGRAGVDLFAYNDATGSWRLVPTTTNDMVDAEDGLWTGASVVVAGSPGYCGYACQNPLSAEAIALYEPAANRWTRLPFASQASGMDFVHPALLWTEAAVVEIADQSQNGASLVNAFDPALNAWQPLPPIGGTAPIPGTECTQAAWTGTQILVACGNRALALTPAAPAGAAPAIPSPPPAVSSPLPAATRPAMPTS